jgi:hypothetical protein
MKPIITKAGRNVKKRETRRQGQDHRIFRMNGVPSSDLILSILSKFIPGFGSSRRRS